MANETCASIGCDVNTKVETIKEFLDKQIEDSRQKTLYLCTAKAKAELLGLLDAPVQEIRSLTDWV